MWIDIEGDTLQACEGNLKVKNAFLVIFASSKQIGLPIHKTIGSGVSFDSWATRIKSISRKRSEPFTGLPDDQVPGHSGYLDSSWGRHNDCLTVNSLQCTRSTARKPIQSSYSKPGCQSHKEWRYHLPCLTYQGNTNQYSTLESHEAELKDSAYRIAGWVPPDIHRNSNRNYHQPSWMYWLVLTRL